MTDPTLNIQIPAKPQANGRPQRAARNNNPGNLRYAGQPGATKDKHGFAVFATAQDGAQALYEQILRDANRGLSATQFLTKYAPPDENDTRRYMARMRKALGAAADGPLAEADPLAVAKFIAHQESNTDLSRFTPRSAEPVMPQQPEGDLTTKAVILGLKALEKLKQGAKVVKEWEAKPGRDLAAAMPKGTRVQEAVLPDWIGGPASKTKWAVVSAANPGGATTSMAENIPLMNKFAKILRQWKVDHIPVTGQYPSSTTGQLIKGEPSFALPSIAEADARALGHAMNQEGILAKRGFVNDVGTFHPSSGVREATPDDLAFFELPDGTRVVSDVNWGVTEKLPALKLKHYSNKLGGAVGETVTTDPAFMGTGLPGREALRTGRPDMIHYYGRGAVPERQFAHMPMYLGESTRPVYDLAKDPMKIIETMSKGGTRGVDVDELERTLQGLGYGFERNTFNAPHIYKGFDKLDMVRKR